MIYLMGMYRKGLKRGGILRDGAVSGISGGQAREETGGVVRKARSGISIIP